MNIEYARYIYIYASTGDPSVGEWKVFLARDLYITMLKCYYSHPNNVVTW